MADTGTLDIGQTKFLDVAGRNPFPDEAISESSGGAILTVGAAAADGTVPVTGVGAGVATITVEPGTEDAGFSAGTIDVTVSAPLVPLPLSLV